MRRIVYGGAAALCLLGSLGALAQQSQTGAQTNPPDHTVPAPPHAQPQAPEADLAKPAAVGPAQADTADKIASQTPPGATPQTMPSTISAQNAALDKLPTTALQFPLTDEQKKLIAKSVDSTAKTPNGANLANVHVAGFIPSDLPMQNFSDMLKQQYPPAARYKYVKLEDRILIVDPSILSVVGEIKL